jgi:short-subunit dehydrogenase
MRFEVKGFGVDVVIIQPGLIRTEFAETAASSATELDEQAGPYREFNAAVGQATKSAYETGPLARFGGGPETVAKAVETAITARSPKIRYRVTPSARFLIGQRKLMSARMWDRFVGTQFPNPADRSGG